MHRSLSLLSSLASVILLTSQANAVEVNIQKGVPYIDVKVKDKTIRIERIQDTTHKLKNSFSKTSRPAPPFSIQPFQPIEGIETISELEVMDFMKNNLDNGSGKLVDARIPKWYTAGSLPFASNIPFPLLSPKEDKKTLSQILSLLKVASTEKGFNFDNAQDLIIFANGPWCQQGVRAMENLVKIGYPKSKIRYYRGGMQYWQILGLNTVIPK